MLNTHTHFKQGKPKGQTDLRAKTVIIPTTKPQPQQANSFRRLISKLLKNDQEGAGE